ncbi:hypothetical protein BGZ63DRAFT_233455 [Mariannaea sp. PMI_226]|nr:hypothetical protein BGZ63DRAFT_233455 [Mariannaea sp. PMI_226]
MISLRVRDDYVTYLLRKTNFGMMNIEHLTLGKYHLDLVVLLSKGRRGVYWFRKTRIGVSAIFQAGFVQFIFSLFFCFERMEDKSDYLVNARAAHWERLRRLYRYLVLGGNLLGSLLARFVILFFSFFP